MSVEGKKKDDGKLRYDCVPDDAEREVVRVLTFGAGKYASGNWAHVPKARRRYSAALRRHVSAWRTGERVDPESGCHHLAHAICCALFLLALDLRGKLPAEDEPDDPA